MDAVAEGVAHGRDAGERRRDGSRTGEASRAREKREHHEDARRLDRVARGDAGTEEGRLDEHAADVERGRRDAEEEQGGRQLRPGH